MRAALFHAAAAACACALGATCLAQEDYVTVISAKAADGYARAKAPDGSYRAETYSFGNGGHWNGAVRDPILSRIAFLDVAKAVVEPLARQGYVASRDPRATHELIMVYWGRTQTPENFSTSEATQSLQDATSKQMDSKEKSDAKIARSEAPVAVPNVGMPCGHLDPDATTVAEADIIDADNAMAGALALSAAQNRTRDAIDAKNASLLGYESWWNATAQMPGTPLEYQRDDMIQELEHDRYFVILMAYDFQGMWRHRTHKLLWETRFSIRERGADFSKALPLMAMNASRYFGRDTSGLVRENLPAGRVEIGTVKTLGVVAQK
ncbi:MAG TPA: hypothetical protein VGG34_03345 [Opitutaceae bacterium]